jgi:hypothetical protein
VEAQLADYKSQAKAIVRTLSGQSESKMFIESRNRVFWCAAAHVQRSVGLWD